MYNSLIAKLFAFTLIFIKLQLIDEVMDTEEASKFDEEQKAAIKDLFSQGVKHKMKTKFVRSLSTSRPSGWLVLCLNTCRIFLSCSDK